MMAVDRIVSWAFLLALILVPVGGKEVRAQRITATVDSAESVIRYTGSAPLHDWTGTSRDVAGRFVLDPEHPDSSRVAIRVPVASFDSGNERRDRKMREVTEAGKYPLVRFRATELHPVQWGRTEDGRAGQWKVRGDLTFHGRTRPVETTATVRVAGKTVRVRTQFPLSLSRFGVERPSILWASIADTIRIDARIVGVRAEFSDTARRSRERPPGGSP